MVEHHAARDPGYPRIESALARSVRIALSSNAVDTHAASHDDRRFGDGTLWSFAGVEVVDLVVPPTPLIPIFRHASAESGGGRVAVMFLLEGEASIQHDQKNFRFSGGSAAYIVTGTHTLVETAEPCRVMMVSVPRAWLQEAGVDVRDTFGAFAYSAARSSPLLSFLSALIEIVLSHSIPSEPTARVLTELVADLFLLDHAYSPGATQPDLDLRSLADSLIALGSSDTAFRASTLASQLQINVAELDQAYQRTGTHGSATAAISERRIMMAMLGLQSSEQNTLTAREIARRAGFASERELHRALKKVYGTTVKEVLLSQTAGQPESQPAPLHPSQFSEREGQSSP